MPGETGVTVVTNSCAFLFRTRGYGRNGRPAFPAPSVFRWRKLIQNSRETRGENANVCPMTVQLHPRLSSPAKAGDPVFQSRQCSFERPQRTGYPAFAGYDGLYLRCNVL